MTEIGKTKRFSYPTRGVCPPEIHFEIREGILEEIRFVGGGCPGNAKLVSRLLAGKPIREVLENLKGIDCRNQTSCPDQLATALRAVQAGTLQPAKSFRLFADECPRQRIGLIGALDGNSAVLSKLLGPLREQGAEAIYCLGNLIGEGGDNKTLLRTMGKEHILAVQGERDWQSAQGVEDAELPELTQKERDLLLQLPQVLTFEMAGKKGIAFHGEYIQSFPGFSDYEPFALEMNMVCGLTDFMRDESVFPALEAMVPQFQADIVVFGQGGQWGHWHVGGKDFISPGPSAGFLEIEAGVVNFARLVT
jgi:uncharacterized protein (TIGR03905 family)